MRANFSIYIILFILLFSVSCSNNKKAKQYISDAEIASKSGNYQLAKLKIDSVKLLFPKAYDEIKSGFALMQEIRLTENRRNIAYCDSMLAINEKLKTEVLKNFEYTHNEKYEEKGTYYPKIYPLQTSLNQNGLRSSVSENGVFFIESVLSGNAIKHHRVKVNTKNNEFAETLPVTSDGLSYSFSAGGRKYEIVRYSGERENGVGKFIYTFQQEPLTIAFIGNKTITRTLNNSQKQGIVQSFELSTLLSEIEKLKFEKERSEVLIRYLESEQKKKKNS